MSWPAGLGSLFRKIGLLAGVNAIVTVAILWFLLTQTGQMTTGYLLAAYFISAIPFLLSGTIVSLVVAETIQRVDRVYFFDLIGAAAGCAVLVKLLNWVGGPNTIVVTAVVFAVTGRSGSIWRGLREAGLCASGSGWHWLH